MVSAGTGSLTETNLAQTISGTITVSDVDSTAAFNPAAVTSVYGKMTLQANGNWTYDANANNSLAGGQVVTDVFTVTSVDGTASTITITLTGTNDAAVISAGTASLTETNLPQTVTCLLYTSPSPRDRQKSRMPSSA